jgi:hypothetical protein
MSARVPCRSYSYSRNSTGPHRVGRMLALAGLDAGLFVEADDVRAVRLEGRGGQIELINCARLGIKSRRILVTLVVQPVATAMGLELHLVQHASQVARRNGLHDLALLDFGCEFPWEISRAESRGSEQATATI